MLRCARVSVKLPPSGLQQAPSQLSTSSFPLHLKLPSSDDTLSSCWDCGGLHERVDGCVSLSRLATEFPALTDKAPTTYIARCKRPCIHSSPLPSGTRMRGPGLLIILTLAAVMLNSRIIRWQHRLLAKGCEQFTLVSLAGLNAPLGDIKLLSIADDIFQMARPQTLL